jgi:stage V sporulation protein AD
VASVTCGYLLRRIQAGELHRVLVVGSGALLSPTTQQQKQTIPGIAYAAALERVMERPVREKILCFLHLGEEVAL